MFLKKLMGISREKSSTESRVDSMELLKLIGKTPLYKLKEDTGGAAVYIKLEGNNPGGSIKDRTVWGMLKSAERDGILNKDTVLVEATSGNTGIGLALLGRALGLRVVLTMPESMSIERRTILKAFGAELILTPASEGIKGSFIAAEQLVKTENNAVMLDQFSNLGNPWAHETTTGPEILSQLPKGKKLAAFVAGFGTAGTIVGIGKALRKKYPNVEVIAIEPASSPLVSTGHAGPHKIQGIGANFVPKLLELDVISRFVTVEDQVAIETSRWLASEEGIFGGISTGANVWAAMEVAKTLSRDSVVVTVQPDRGDKYLSVFND